MSSSGTREASSAQLGFFGAGIPLTTAGVGSLLSESTAVAARSAGTHRARAARRTAYSVYKVPAQAQMKPTGTVSSATAPVPSDPKEPKWADEPVLLPTLPDDQKARHVSCDPCDGPLKLFAVSDAAKVYEYQCHPMDEFQAVEGLPDGHCFARTVCGSNRVFALDTVGELYAWGATGPALGVGSHFPHPSMSKGSAESVTVTPPMQVVLDTSVHTLGVRNSGAGQQMSALFVQLGRVSPYNIAITAVDVDKAQAKRYQMETKVGSLCFTSPNGPKLLLSQPGSSGAILRWTFRVDGNSSWSVGIVPEAAADEDDYLMRLGTVGLDSGGLSGGVMRREQLQDKWISLAYHCDLGVAEFLIGERRIELRGGFTGAVRLGLSTFNGCRCTMATDPNVIRAVMQSETVLQVGDRVSLSPNYRESGDDAVAGPLVPGAVGTVVEIDETAQPYLVRTEGDQRWWYARASLAAVAPRIKSETQMLSNHDAKDGVLDNILVSVADRLIAAVKSENEESLEPPANLIEAMRRFLTADIFTALPIRYHLGNDIVPENFIIPSRLVVDELSFICREQLVRCSTDMKEHLPSLIRIMRLLTENLKCMILPGRIQRSLSKEECLNGHKLAMTSGIDTASCNVCLRGGYVLGDGARGCSECQWYTCKVCYGQARRTGNCHDFGLSSPALDVVQNNIKCICTLAIDLLDFLENQTMLSGLRVDLFDFFDLNCSVTDLIAAVSRLAAHVKGCGEGFLVPLLGLHLQERTPEPERQAANCWIPTKPSKRFQTVALNGFLQNITTVESALELLFPELIEFAVVSEFSALEKLLGSVLDFVSRHSCSSLHQIVKLSDHFHLALGNIQVALFLSLCSPKKFVEHSRLVNVVCDKWVLNVIGLFCTFVKTCEDEVVSSLELMSRDQESADTLNTVADFIEAQINASLFRTLLPAIVSGLQICDWSLMPSAMITKLFDCCRKMQSLISILPSWSSVDLYWTAHVWQQPSDCGLWFISCSKLIHRMTLTKPFERVNIAPELFKWLDESPFSLYSLGNMRKTAPSRVGDGHSPWFQKDEEFWLSVEANVEPSSIIPASTARHLVRRAAEAVLHLTSDVTGHMSAKLPHSQQVAQLYIVCSRAIAKCPWISKADDKDWEGACERALLLLEFAVIGQEKDESISETEILSSTTKTDFRHNDSGRALLLRGLSENLRRLNSKGALDRDSLCVSSILEFVLDRSVSAEDVRREVALRNRRLEVCISLLEMDRVYVSEKNSHEKNVDSTLGLILSSVSEGRLHYLDGFGGADAELRKNYEDNVLGLLSDAIDVQPSADDFAFSAVCFGSFSFLAIVKMNDAGIAKLLERKAWSKLVQLQVDTSGDESLALEEPGNAKNFAMISLAIMCAYVLETFQPRIFSANRTTWQGVILTDLLVWLKSKSCSASGLRRALDILSLCAHDVRLLTMIKMKTDVGFSVTATVLRGLLDFFLDRCLASSKQVIECESIALLAPRILGLLSKWLGSSSPNEFDMGTMHYPCEEQAIIPGDSPAGLRSLLVFAKYLSRASLWNWDVMGCDFIEDSAAARISPGDRLILSQSVADFLGGFIRQPRWSCAVISCCRHFLCKNDVIGSETSSTHAVRVLIALAMMGGNIPIVREGATVMLPNSLSDSGQGEAVVVQFKFSEERALVAKQDGELSWISVTQLSPISAQIDCMGMEHLELLQPLLKWHVTRILAESDLKGIILGNRTQEREEHVSFIPDNLQIRFFFARFQGAMAMHILSKLVLRHASSTYKILSHPDISGQTVADRLNQCALLCPEDVLGEQNLRFNIHTLAEKAAALQYALYSRANTHERKALTTPGGLEELHRSSTISGHSVNLTFTKNRNLIPVPVQRGLSGLGVQRHKLWKEHSGADAIHGISAEEHLKALSSAFRDLTLSFAVNCAIELLPEHLDSMQSEAIATEPNAQVIMKLLHLAVCFALPRERVCGVLERLLSSDHVGLPEYFIRVLLESARPGRWLQIAEDPIIRQTIRCEEGNSAKWNSDLEFGGNKEVHVQEVKIVKGFTATKMGKIVMVCCTETQSEELVVEAVGATWAKIESCHNYHDNARYSGSVQIVGAKGLSISFDSRCSTESGCDMLSFFRDSQMTDMIRSFSGIGNWNDFSIPDKDTIFYTFGSDGSTNYWGYRWAIGAFLFLGLSIHTSGLRLHLEFAPLFFVNHDTHLLSSVFCRFTVKSMTSDPGIVVSSKSMALIELCLLTFDLSRAKASLWPSVFLCEWCKLMIAVATSFADDKARHAIDSITWLLDKLDKFALNETPGPALFAPLQLALHNALQSSKECVNTCGRVGNFATSLFARFFLVFERVKRQLVERLSKPLVESTWKSSSSSILKKEDSVQALFLPNYSFCFISLCLMKICTFIPELPS